MNKTLDQLTKVLLNLCENSDGFIDKAHPQTLMPTDYLLQAPTSDQYQLTQKRLATLKARIAQNQAREEAEKKQQEKHSKLLAGLLGG